LGLRPAEFWALSPRQFASYQTEYERRQHADAELLRVLIGRAALIFAAPYSGDNPLTLDDYCPPFLDAEAPPASQEADPEALFRANELRFDALWRYAESVNGGKSRS
jgi:hypothetical protein